MGYPLGYKYNTGGNRETLSPSWWWKILETNPPASKRTPNEKG